MAVDFNNSNNEHVEVADDASISPGSGDFSIGGFIRADSFPSQNRGIAIKGKGGANQKRYLLFTRDAGTGDDRIRFDLDDDGGGGLVSVDGDTTLSTGQWYHVVGVRDGNNLRVYLDGSEDDTPTDITGYGDIDQANSLILGANRDTGGVKEAWDGQLRDFRYFDRALGADEIAIWAAGYTGPLGGEQLWIRFADAKGVADWDGTSLGTSNVLADLSGNGNDGTPQNTPTARAYDGPWMSAAGWTWHTFTTIITQAVAGSIAPAGAMTRLTSTSKAGSISPSGAVTKLVSLANFAGSISPSGALSTVLTFAQSVAGSISPSGALSTAATFVQAVAGSISPSGSLTAAFQVILNAVARFVATITEDATYRDTITGTARYDDRIDEDSHLL